LLFYKNALNVIIVFSLYVQIVYTRRQTLGEGDSLFKSSTRMNDCLFHKLHSHGVYQNETAWSLFQIVHRHGHVMVNNWIGEYLNDGIFFVNRYKNCSAKRISSRDINCADTIIIASRKRVFTVTGTAAYTYAITLPTTVTLTRASGSETMDATAFTSNPSGTGTLSGGGTQNFNVGATLTVAAGQAAGVYTSGNFDVTVNYN
jgi:hypothetical protein